MQHTFMITNGGPHPADKWADVTTETILNLIEIQEDSDTPEATEARAVKRGLRTVLFDIFMGHHDGVQKHERGQLIQNVKDHKAARKHCERLIDVTPHLSVMGEVNAALAATPFAAHFAQPNVREVLKQIVGSHTASAINIERRWHADRHEAAAKEA